jgi:hypothetical protein
MTRWGVLGGASAIPLYRGQSIYNVGCREVRVIFRWRSVESVQGTYDWTIPDAIVRSCAQASLFPVPILIDTPAWMNPDRRAPPSDLWAWAGFCYTVAGRYKPGGAFWQANPSLPQYPIKLYEIWNEPNLFGQDWIGSASQYASLYNVALYWIHSLNAGVEVMVGGLAYAPDPLAAGGYLDQLKAQGINTPDAVGYHPYGFSARIDGSANTAYSNTISRIKRCENKLNDLGWIYAGLDITEDGIPTKWFVNNEWVYYPEQSDGTTTSGTRPGPSNKAIHARAATTSIPGTPRMYSTSPMMRFGDTPPTATTEESMSRPDCLWLGREQNGLDV